MDTNGSSRVRATVEEVIVQAPNGVGEAVGSAAPVHAPAGDEVEPVEAANGVVHALEVLDDVEPVESGNGTVHEVEREAEVEPVEAPDGAVEDAQEAAAVEAPTQADEARFENVAAPRRARRPRRQRRERPNGPIGPIGRKTYTFRVDFVGEREFQADSLRAAVAQAEAQGLRDILAVSLVDEAL